MDNQKGLVFQKLRDSGIHRNKNLNCSYVMVLVVEFLGFFLNLIFKNIFEALYLMVLVSTVRIAPAVHQVWGF